MFYLFSNRLKQIQVKLPFLGSVFLNNMMFSVINLFVCLFVCLSVCLSVCLFVCLFVWLVGWLFVCLFVRFDVETLCKGHNSIDHLGSIFRGQSF